MIFKLKKVKKLKNNLNLIASKLGSKAFYYFIIAFFLLESIWIAFSANYPQAFDENFHFGLIKTYSHYWLPFLSKQPPHANSYGAVAVDTSYLYHYLMSFPYRIIELFIHAQAGQVITLRLIDVAMFTFGLVLFRKLLLRAGMSKSLTNVSLLIFVLIPIVPQLAAQVNYDDMFFPVTAWACLKSFDVIDDIKAHKPSAKRLLQLLIICFLGSIVKFAFLPIFLAIVMVLVIYMYRSYKGNLKQLVSHYTKDFLGLTRLAKIALPLLLLISIGLVFQRDGLDFIKYHSVEPDCSRVLTVKECSAYSPWLYNYADHTNVVSGKYVASDSLLTYTGNWFYFTWYRLYFSVNGITSSGDFANYPPLPLPGIAAVAVFALGVVSLLIARRKVLHRNPYLLLLFSICIVYTLVLYAQGYQTYKYTAILENMNGRYLLPILLPIAAIIGMGLSSVLGRSKWPKSALALVVLVMFIEGGGTVAFIDRSDSTWYWNNAAVQNVNKTAHKVVKRVVLTKPVLEK
jgi:hypothetical protein